MTQMIKRNDVIGPYSAWPRQTKWRRKPLILGSLGFACAGVFVHCGLPLLMTL